MILTYLNKNK